MNLTSENFDSTLDKELKRIDDYYKAGPDNFEIAGLYAHKTCLTCIKTHGYPFISTYKFEKNDCNSGYLNYDELSWNDLIQKVLNVTIGGRKKTRKNNKNKKSRHNRKKTKRRNRRFKI